MSEAEGQSVIQEVRARFGAEAVTEQATRDEVPTLWVSRERLPEVVRYLKIVVPGPYRTLYDLTAIDERVRVNRRGQPPGAFTVVYHLLSYERNSDVRLKVALTEEDPVLPSIVGIWPSANWYEREVWDMFGIVFDGHPDLRRILLPPTWKGHPLRKDHPARGTEMGLSHFRLPDGPGAGRRPTRPGGCPPAGGGIPGAYRAARAAAHRPGAGCGPGRRGSGGREACNRG